MKKKESRILFFQKVFQKEKATTKRFARTVRVQYYTDFHEQYQSNCRFWSARPHKKLRQKFTLTQSNRSKESLREETTQKVRSFITSNQTVLNLKNAWRSLVLTSDGKALTRRTTCVNRTSDRPSWIDQKRLAILSRHSLKRRPHKKSKVLFKPDRVNTWDFIVLSGDHTKSARTIP